MVLEGGTGLKSEQECENNRAKQICTKSDLFVLVVRIIGRTGIPELWELKIAW